MRSIVVVCAFVFAAAPAAAQSTYVGASLMGEFSRYSGLDFDENDTRRASGLRSRDGETIGFDLKVGRAISERWGVELAFARGGVNEKRQTERLFPASITSVSNRGTPIGPGITPPLPINPILPIPDVEFALEMEEQSTTVATTAWVRQELGDRAALVFSGGISFNHVESEQHVRITDPRLAIYLPYPSEIESTVYDVGPVAGAEALIDVGEHAALTAGVRLHGISGGWLIRPSVGLRWSF